VNVRIETAGTREQRKQQTREELLASALALLESKSFGALSLREVARGAGVVPTAFYRHFESMDELGLALVDESFRSLREMLREARSGPLEPQHVIRSSVKILVEHVRGNQRHFRFIARERYSGDPALRQAIRAEIRLISTELAADLRRFPYLGEWEMDDLLALAGLIVNAMVLTVEEILESVPRGTRAEAEVIATAERQLAMIVVGVPLWRGAG
jgi:AcrR family transcriptional regulator